MTIMKRSPERKEKEEEEDEEKLEKEKKKFKRRNKTTHITNWASHVYQKNNLRMSFVQNQVLLQHLNQMLN